MRVALTSYPMLWQRTGGLQVQITETLAALRQLGCDARLLDTNRERIGDYDLLHVFGAINGNDRIVEAGVDAGVPVVVSSVLNPPFSRWDAMRAHTGALINGRLTGWDFSTSYEQTCRAVQSANAVIALGTAEKTLLVNGYQVPTERIHVIPNGISERFFKAMPETFRAQSGIEGPFLLHISSVSPYKNPLMSARVAARVGLPLVLIGPTARRDEPYLERCRREATAGFHYLGALKPDSELLASAYAAASVLLLPSRSEVMPLVVLEALAAGTPIVMTKHSSLSFDHSKPMVQTVDPNDLRMLVKVTQSVLSDRISSAECRLLVSDMSWRHVAEKLLILYENIHAGPSRPNM